ncbi:acid protease [Dentipellis sp. KUC8613]|nr:acid protease [Dentipellis sp. KUC8613]
MAYTASVKVGTVPTAYTVLVDCGSSEFWLVSDTCKQRGRRVPFGRSTSQTVQFWEGSWGTAYEDDSSLTGLFVLDDVTVGGRTLPGLPFGSAVTLTGTLAADPYDGIMGFGFADSSRTGAPTILDALVDAGFISNHITGWKLSRNADGRNDGEITFGGENDAIFFKDRQVFVQNLSGGRFKTWKVSIDGISMDGSQIISAGVGIVDTGCTEVLMHPFDAFAIHNVVPGAVLLRDSTYAFPCDAQPMLSITIGGSQFDVDPRDVVGYTLPNGFCRSNIFPDEMRQQGEVLLGVAFLKNVYLTLDVTRDRIGFAELR